MMRNLFLLPLLLAGILFAGCKKDKINYKNEYKKSYQEWLSFKSSSDNSYQYTVATSSWTGVSSQTVITVRNGKVVKRSFQYFSPAGWPETIPDDVRAWTENEGEIGLHKDAGAAPVTLDEVYDKAHDYWLKKRENAKTYFEAKNNGLISSCGFVEYGCADDCFRGIRIINISV